MTTTPRPRRLGGWGFEGERLEPSGAMLAWLAERFVAGPAVPAFDAASAGAFVTGRALPEVAGLAGVSTDPLDRPAHARGQGLTDLVRLRSGSVPAVPDGVLRPYDAAAVAAAIVACDREGLHLTPWGGGTSVTGGVNTQPSRRADDPPGVVLDLSQLSGLLTLDDDSGLATFGAGTTGPDVEAALAPHGLTLGHFPQSWELSTVGGWIATRASGQESMGFGRIEDLVAGVEASAPAGALRVRPRPAAAVGPDPLALLLGSEGRLGVITAATLRVRPAPAAREVRAYLLPDWRAALDAVRELALSGLPLAMLRLSDPPETEVAMATGLAGHRLAGTALRGWLRLHGRRGFGCLLLLGAAGSPGTLWSAHGGAAESLTRFRALGLGSGPGRKWLGDRFRHPYLRDALLDRGIATDTFETAGPWSSLATIAEAVSAALPVPVLAHVSHPYRDGASLSFTLFFPCSSEADATVARWAELKRTATRALLDAGGTLSHHHGIGNWHAPWYREAVGPPLADALAAAARALDPHGTLNPSALFAPHDRLDI